MSRIRRLLNAYLLYRLAKPHVATYITQLVGGGGDSASGGVAAAHDLGGATHNADTLANLNTKVSDGTLVKSGAIVNVDINAAAAIAYTKLALANEILSTDIKDGEIVNADVNAAAAIAESKLAFDSAAGHDHDDVGSQQVDHGNLGGRTDDDHVRYFDKDGSKAMTGNLDMGTSDLIFGGVAGTDIRIRHPDAAGGPLEIRNAADDDYEDLSVSGLIVNGEAISAAIDVGIDLNIPIGTNNCYAVDMRSDRNNATLSFYMYNTDDTPVEGVEGTKVGCNYQLNNDAAAEMKCFSQTGYWIDSAAGNETTACKMSLKDSGLNCHTLRMEGKRNRILTDAPSGAGDTGSDGSFTWDTRYWYICTATDTWRRLPVRTWDYIEHHAANDTLTIAESDTAHTNLGAGGIITLTLPQNAVQGTTFEFAVMEANWLRIDPGAAGAVYINGAKQTDNKYITADDEGESVKLVCDGNGDWIAMYATGTWSVEP